MKEIIDLNLKHLIVGHDFLGVCFQALYLIGIKRKKSIYGKCC